MCVCIHIYIYMPVKIRSLTGQLKINNWSKMQTICCASVFSAKFIFFPVFPLPHHEVFISLALLQVGTPHIVIRLYGWSCRRFSRRKHTTAVDTGNTSNLAKNTFIFIWSSVSFNNDAIRVSHSNFPKSINIHQRKYISWVWTQIWNYKSAFFASL